jgi:hypothetical protein
MDHRWIDTRYGDDSLSTLGMCVSINDAWNAPPSCSSVTGGIWRVRDSGNVNFSGSHDPALGTVAGYRRKAEIVGLFACGQLPENNAGDRSYIKERTNVAFVPWSNSGNGSYTFSNGVRVKLK